MHARAQVEDHDLGLSHDLPTLLSRRGMLAAFAGIGAVALAACGDDAASGTSASSASAGSSEELIPTETAGPYPGDGSNGPNVLTESGIGHGPAYR